MQELLTEDPLVLEKVLEKIKNLGNSGVSRQSEPEPCQQESSPEISKNGPILAKKCENVPRTELTSQSRSSFTRNKSELTSSSVINKR